MDSRVDRRSGTAISAISIADRVPAAGWWKGWRPGYRAILWAAFLWAALNCVIVYLALHDAHTYRLESAVWIFVVLLAPLVIASRRSDPSFIELSRAQGRLIFGIAAGLWIATFVPLVSFPFLSDDYVFLAGVRTFGDVFAHAFFFRPAFKALFLILARVDGGSPLAFHLAGLGLHLLAACLVFAIARRLFVASTPALIAFCVFLLNPLQLEATLWVSGLQELLWTVCTLGAIRCYIGSSTLTWPRIVATLGLEAIALLSKETAVCLVLLLPSVDWLLFRMRRGRLLPAAYASSGLLLVIYLAVRHQFTSIGPDVIPTPSRFLAQQFLSIPYRLFPQPWSTAIAFPPPIVPCVISLLVISAIFLRVVVRGASDRLLMGPAFILISTLPLLAYFFVRTDLAEARYLYFAAAGWAFLVAELLVVLTRRSLMTTAICGLSIALALTLQVNLRPWRVAGSLVAQMHGVLREGQSVETVLTPLKAHPPRGLSFENGTPREYRGVGIFINGYSEFLKLGRDGH